MTRSTDDPPPTRAPEPEPVADVGVVGGGPVGLLLGCRLAQLGVRFRVLERQSQPSAHSRAIGIHPPSLERLERLGVVDAFVARGVRVPGGTAVAGQRELGELSFEACRPPYRFVLSLPQPDTERLLEQRLAELAPGALERGVSVDQIHQSDEGVSARCTPAEGPAAIRHFRLLVGCDGKRSLTRQSLGIPFEGAPYPDSYVMGDFPDNTGFGARARLYLHADGVVESFPLPGDLRRWVMRVPEAVDRPERAPFCREIRRRTGHDLDGLPAHMLSAFGIQRYLAPRFHRGRVVLAGDAAHVTSPIGGQGMNSGWLDAWDLADALEAILARSAAVEPTLARYSERAGRRAARVIRRAELNTVMGRATRLSPLRGAAVWTLLHSPIKRSLARMFTMRGL